MKHSLGKVLSRDEAVPVLKSRPTYMEKHDLLDVFARPGSSGGAYFDKNGYVRGIIVGGVRPPESPVSQVLGVSASVVTTELKSQIGEVAASKILNSCNALNTTRQAVREMFKN